MSWLNDLLDTKIPGTAAPVSPVGDLSRDPVAEESAQRDAQRAADVSKLQLDQQNRDAIDKAAYTPVAPGTYAPTGDPRNPGAGVGYDSDMAVRKDLIEKRGMDQGQVQDPYGIRGGMDIDQVGPPNPTADQMAAMKLTPESVAAAGTEPHNRPMAQSSHVRGGSPGQQPGGPAAEGEITSAPTKIDDDVHQALVSQGVDPRVAAMLADAQKRQSQLQEGLDKSKSERFFANEHFAMQSGFGIRGAKETLDSNIQGIDQRYKGIQDQQKAGDEALTHAEAQRSFTRALDADNKDSELSHETARVMGMKPGSIPASLAPDAMKVAKQRLEERQARDQNTRNAATIQGEGERNAATNKKDIDVALIRARSERAGRAPKTATQEQQDRLADLRAARAMVQKLDKDQTEGDINGPLSRLSALAGKVGIDTDAAKVDAQGKIASRVTGRGIEGGKFSDKDADFYQQYGVGQAGDPPELQRAKNKAALKRIDDKERELITSMSEAGVDTSQITTRSSAGRPVVGPKGEKGTLAPGHPLPSGWSYR